MQARYVKLGSTSRGLVGARINRGARDEAAQRAQLRLCCVANNRILILR